MGASIGRCTLVCRPRELGGDGQCTQMARWGVLDARVRGGNPAGRSSCAQVFGGAVLALLVSNARESVEGVGVQFRLGCQVWTSPGSPACTRVNAALEIPRLVRSGFSPSGCPLRLWKPGRRLCQVKSGFTRER